jgi:hypothetical protein
LAGATLPDAAAAAGLLAELAPVGGALLVVAGFDCGALAGGAVAGAAVAGARVGCTGVL